MTYDVGGSVAEAKCNTPCLGDKTQMCGVDQQVKENWVAERMVRPPSLPGIFGAQCRQSIAQ
eukprot:SAG11_NODE_25316_length_360_cov_1.057471_1_plen_62_part_00